MEGRVNERLWDERRGECFLIHILGEAGNVDRIPAVENWKLGMEFSFSAGMMFF